QNNVIETFVPISLSPGNNTQTQYWNNKSNSDYNALNAYVAYQFDINKSHNFKIMAGFAQEQRVYKALNVTRKDLINPSLPSISGSTGETISTDDYKEYIIRGGYFRANYDYKSKYLLEVNGRYDGSSKFPRSNRYGFFPSVSAGYRLAEEKFMDWSNKWLNEFK
ncbi:MAG: TonB-dependent receptor, partial [Rikenellaceae bacterium]